MNYWYFRVDHPFPAGSEKMDGFDHSLELIQRRRFAGGKGDQAVILTSLDKLSFVAIGVVNNVEEGKLDEMGYRSIKVSMRLQWNHNELNLLDDFAYSLTRVRDFNRPERSFTRIYGRLEGVEVKAIKSGEIFIRRTVFGHLVNALHIDHRQSFIEWFISNNYKAA
ncbi:MAG: hypothetical protein KDC19_12395, partial [Saprospiraceae bacterium]|nr:hypothetical protein [Saprospiraceae bacterium]